MNYTLIGFIVYLIGVIVVGIITSRLNKTHKDFFIAGRKLNPWVVAFSERASGESAWLLLGLPGATFAAGFLELWTALGCIIGIAFSWFVIAKELRIQTEKTDSITLPDFFAKKLGKDDKILHIVSMLIIVFFYTFYLAAQFNGAGKVLNVTFGIPHINGMIIGAIVIIFYTMMGGFFAVAWSDLIQGIIMISTLTLLPIIGLIEINGMGHSLSSSLASAGSEFVSTVGGKTGWAEIKVIIEGLSWGLGYMGAPHLVTRFMAIRNPEGIKKSRTIAIIWTIPAFTGALLIGIIGFSLYGKGYFLDVENIMPHLATTLLPSWIAGIFISGAIAAMMSTADSQLLVISSSVLEDFYHKVLGKESSDKMLLLLSRLITVIVGLMGIFIALTSKKVIFTLVSYACAGLGSSFGPALLLMLKWKRTTKKGVLAGMLTGSISTIVWTSIPILNNFITVRFASFMLAFAAIVLVSLGTKKETKLY